MSDYKAKWDKNFIGIYNQLPIVIKKGNGSTIFDEDGKKYIDFTSGIGVSSLGYNHPKLTETLKNQIENIMHTSNIFFNEPLLLTGEKIVSLSKLDKVFFCNSGTESNEAAIKIARKYSYNNYGKNRGTIISLNDSFHGRTMSSLMATGQEKYHDYFFPLPNGFEYANRNDISSFKECLDDTVCAVMLEAIQGEGGIFPLDKDYVKEVEKICIEKDILMIFDEVQCGIGRTGKLFAYEYYDVNPDIVSFAKGIGGGVPVGGVLTNKKTSSVLVKGDHGATFGGNALAMSAAGVVLDEIESDGFYDEVIKKGEIIKKEIESCNFSNVKDVRGKGLMIGIEVEEGSSDIQKKALESGLLILTAGKNVLRLLPPLTISYEEIEEGLKILKSCF